MLVLNYRSMDGWWINSKYVIVIDLSIENRWINVNVYTVDGWIMNGEQINGGWMVQEWENRWQINGWFLGGRIMDCVL